MMLGRRRCYCGINLFELVCLLALFYEVLLLSLLSLLFILLLFVFALVVYIGIVIIIVVDDDAVVVLAQNKTHLKDKGIGAFIPEYQQFTGS